MVDELLATGGIIVSHETVRQWVLKFGQVLANQIRRRLPRAGDKWHRDEVVLTIAGAMHCLWREGDQTGMVLDILVQSRRDERAAKRLPRKLPERQCRTPRVIVTDKLASYGVAKCRVMLLVEHRKHKRLNKAETSHPAHAPARAADSGSSQPARHNASSPPTTGSTTSSTSAVTKCPPPSIEPPGPRPFKFGPRSPGLPPRRDHGHAVFAAPHRDLHPTS